MGSLAGIPIGMGSYTIEVIWIPGSLGSMRFQDSSYTPLDTGRGVFLENRYSSPAGGSQPRDPAVFGSWKHLGVFQKSRSVPVPVLGSVAY